MNRNHSETIVKIQASCIFIKINGPLFTTRISYESRILFNQLKFVAVLQYVFPQMISLLLQLHKILISNVSCYCHEHSHNISPL